MTWDEFRNWVFRFSNNAWFRYWNDWPGTGEMEKVIGFKSTQKTWQQMGVHDVGFEYFKTEQFTPMEFYHYFKVTIKKEAQP